MKPGFPKVKEGISEPIVAPEIPIIDAHHHLFDRHAAKYMYDDFRADTKRGHRVIASVYVETQAMIRQDGPEIMRALGEIEFAAGVGAMADSGLYGECRVGAAIVSFADMSRGTEIAPFLDAAMTMAPARFRGVRQIALAHPDPGMLRFLTHKPPSDLLKSDAFNDALTELGRRGLTFDLTVMHNQLPDVEYILRRHQNTIFVLDHMGLATPLEKSPESRALAFQEWRQNMALLAQHKNLYVKIGGLGTSYWGFPQYMREKPVTSEELIETWRPYVETALDIFGADRCMAQSNYPNDGRSCGYVPLWNALKSIVRGCSKDELGALFHGTAIQVYRIDGIEVPEW